MPQATTDIPARLDRLPWSRFHTAIVVGLGITWILDGLEVTIVGSISPRLQDRATLGLSATGIGFAATAYLLGAVAGSLGFGYLTDRLGRKKLFLVTLAWYVVATLLTACSWDAASFVVFRFSTGFGIGGEYAAINSTIDELVPSRVRGRVDLAINGTYWLGAMLGSGASILLLDPRLVDQHVGWRIAFALGAILALAILFVRRGIPESPRWLLTHGRGEEAETTLAAIETRVRAERGPLPSVATDPMRFDPTRRSGLADVARTMIRTYPARTLVALALMIAQAFLYNAFFFTQGLVLGTFFHVPANEIGRYTLPFAACNLLGAVLLGRVFDAGRKRAIVVTYALTGVLFVATGALFVRGALDAVAITICWCVTFFIASASASSAYLTVSEIFPLDVRASAIAIVYSAGTLVGGAAGPSIFSALVATRRPSAVFAGYALASGLMLIAAAIEWRFGIETAGKSLEEIAAPLGMAPAARRG